MAASFHILSNSPFTYHIFIRRYIVTEKQSQNNNCSLVYVSFLKSILVTNFRVLQSLTVGQEISRLLWNIRYVPCTQYPKTETRPEPDQSGPHPSTHFLSSVSILSSHSYVIITHKEISTLVDILVTNININDISTSQIILAVKIFQLKFCKNFSSPLRIPHAHRTLFLFILSTQYLAKSAKMKHLIM
jgi:hypothetical protein